MKRQDYEELAKEAVAMFIDDGTSLEDGIVKVAKREELNPEQVKRVVEMANTGAFLDLFRKTAGDDRMVEFEVADPQSTLDKYYGGPVDVRPVKQASDDPTNPPPEDEGDGLFFDDVADENSAEESMEEGGCDCEGGCESCSCKTAAWEPRVSARNAEWNAVRIARTMDGLRDKIASAFYFCDDLSQAIAEDFRGMYSREKLATWEQDSLAAYGSDAVHCINAVREKLGYPTYTQMPDEGTVKVAAQYRVYDESPALIAAGHFIVSRERGLHAQTGLELMESRYGK